MGLGIDPGLRVDHELCVGSATCVSIAPRAFALGADRLSQVIDPYGEPRAAILEAVDQSPMGAISVDLKALKAPPSD